MIIWNLSHITNTCQGIVESTFVNQIMTKYVLSLEKSFSIQDAAEKMKSDKVGSIIVTDNDKPIGILTERDFVTRVAAEGRPMFTEISQVMSSPLISIDHQETIWEASEIMKKKNIHKLPVIEDGQIVGIVTTSDIVKISSSGSDSQMRKVCDQILMRIKDE